MATRTISIAGGNYNSTLSFDEGAVPTSADDVVARGDGLSGNLTVNVNSACRSADFTNYAGVFTCNGVNRFFDIGDAGGGSLKLVSGMTLTMGSSAAFRFVSTTVGNQITSAGKSILRVNFTGIGGEWTLQDALTTTQTATASLSISAGTLITNDKAVTCSRFAITGTNSLTVTLGNSTVTCNGTSDVFIVSGTLGNVTVNAGTSTIVLSNVADKTFTGGGKTYNSVSITTGGSGTVTFADSNTFANIAVTGGSTATVVFTAGTTTTLTGGQSSFPSGSVGNLITVQSSSAGSAFTLNKTSGTLSCSYLSLKDSTASGGATFYANGSTNVSGNTGWSFDVLPTFDAASNSGYQAAASTYNVTHACTGTNLFLRAEVEILSVPGTTVTGITYNGVAMTFIDAKSTVSGAGRVEFWGLINPATGSHTLTPTLSASVASATTACSYTGVHQTAPTEAFNSAQATNVGAADATVDVTTVAANDLVVAACVTDDSSITAGQTSRNNVTGAVGSGANEDNTSLTASPGAVTVNYTGVGALATWAIGGYALRPTTAVAPNGAVGSTIGSGTVGSSLVRSGGAIV